MDHERPFALLRLATVPAASALALATPRAATAVRALVARRRALVDAAAILSDRLYAAVPAVADSRHRGRLLGLRRDLHRGEDAPLDWRLSALSPARLELVRPFVSSDLLADLDAHAGEWGKFEAAERDAASSFETEHSEARERLRHAFRSDFMREMVFLASGNLYESLLRYDTMPLGAFGRREWRTESTLAQLLARASLKTIPQGLVGASGLADIASRRRTTLRLMPSEHRIHRRRTMMDGFVFGRAVAELSRVVEPADKLRPFVNPTLYRKHADAASADASADAARGGRLVFWRDRGTGEGLERCEAPAHPVAKVFLRLARPQSLNAAELVRAVAAETGPAVPIERAWAFYRRLIDEGLLIAALHRSSNASNVFAEIYEQLHGLPANRTEPVLAPLRRMETLLAAADAPLASWSDRWNAYRDLGSAVRVLSPKAVMTPDELVVVDSIIETKGALSRKIVEDLERAARWYLHFADPVHERICSRRPGGGTLVPIFRKRFGKRRVPLGEAADALASLLESGDSGRAPPAGPKETENPTADSPRDGYWGDHVTWPRLENLDSPEAHFVTWLTARVAEASQAGEEQVTVTETDLRRFGSSPGPSALAPIDVVFSVAAEGGAPDGDGSLVTLDLLSYPGALSGRFADLFGAAHGEPPPACPSPVAARHASALAAGRTPACRAILAEIAATSDRPRIANAGRRGRVTPFDIEVCAPPSGRPREEVLTADDLFLELSAEADRIVLWSARLARPVEPTFHSALAPSFDRTVALLCQIGTWTTPSAPLFRRFPFGSPRPRYFPRVAFGQVVLSRRRWEFAPAQCPPRERAEWRFFAAVQEWRAAQGLPRWVWATIEEGARPLPVDLECPFLLRGLSRLLREAQSLDVEEMLPAPSHLWLESNHGAHAFQALVTLPLPSDD